MNIRILAIIGAAVFAGACGSSKPASSDKQTKSGNCAGASVVTRFSPDRSAKAFPETVWLEDCRDGRFYFIRTGNDSAWQEITKATADFTAATLKKAGRAYVRVVDSQP
jgi:hypothetical protein